MTRTLFTLDDLVRLDRLAAQYDFRARTAKSTSEHCEFMQSAAHLRQLRAKVETAIERWPTPGRKPLTPRQLDVYRWVYRETRANGFAPSFAEIAAHFGFTSIATVHEHMDNIERKGYFKREFNMARSLTCLVAIDEVIEEPKITMAVRA